MNSRRFEIRRNHALERAKMAIFGSWRYCSEFQTSSILRTVTVIVRRLDVRTLDKMKNEGSRMEIKAERQSDSGRAPRSIFILWGTMTFLTALLALFTDLPSFLIWECLALCLIGFFFLHKLNFVSTGAETLSKMKRWIIAIAIQCIAQWVIFMSVVKFGWVTFFIAYLIPEHRCASLFEGTLCQMAHRDGPENYGTGNVKRISLFRARAGVDDVCHDDDALKSSDVRDRRQVFQCQQIGSYCVILYLSE